MVSLEKNQTCSLVRISAGKKASQILLMVMVKEEQNSSKRYKARLVVKGFQQKRRVYYNEIFSLVVKMTTISWAERKPRVQIKGNYVQTDSSTEAKAPTWQNSISLSDSWNKKPCRDVHQVGDEREIEALRSFNWPPREMITEYGVLSERERGYSQFNDVSSRYLVSKVS
ncbi:retrovirus-related pol polyprotein from transposon TNT 1-94 [Tanacetum coccineum]